jgi:hypothetical protein
VPVPVLLLLLLLLLPSQLQVLSAAERTVGRVGLAVRSLEAEDDHHQRRRRPPQRPVRDAAAAAGRRVWSSCARGGGMRARPARRHASTHVITPQRGPTCAPAPLPARLRHPAGLHGADRRAGRRPLPKRVAGCWLSTLHTSLLAIGAGRAREPSGGGGNSVGRVEKRAAACVARRGCRALTGSSAQAAAADGRVVERAAGWMVPVGRGAPGRLDIGQLDSPSGFTTSVGRCPRTIDRGASFERPYCTAPLPLGRRSAPCLPWHPAGTRAAARKRRPAGLATHLRIPQTRTRCSRPAPRRTVTRAPPLSTTAAAARSPGPSARR